MNIQFENRYYSDKLMISEYVHKILCKRIYIMGAVVAPIALIMTGITLIRQDYILTSFRSLSIYPYFHDSDYPPNDHKTDAGI